MLLVAAVGLLGAVLLLLREVVQTLFSVWDWELHAEGLVVLGFARTLVTFLLTIHLLF